MAMGDPQISEDCREISIDIIPEILLRLPTKDFVRSSCVCKLWRSIVIDPSFRKLHVAHHAAAATSSSKPEVLLVTETGDPGRSDDASFFNLSSGTALSQIAIPSGYRLAGICNDLLYFVSVSKFDQYQGPAIVCNPVTGETLQLPKAPPLPELSHLFVLGFSALTKEYKMFRLSYKSRTMYIAVYTLGDGGGWRQSSYISRFHPIQSPAPVHINGNLFVTTEGVNNRRRSARMLVLDVATETWRSYHIPYNYNDYYKDWEMMADGFDLNGQMCLIVNVEFHPHPRPKSQFWVLKTPGELEGKDVDEDDDKVYWDLRYSFYFDGPLLFDMPRSAWIDPALMLCYKVGNYVYMYDTRRYSSCSNVDSLLFDEELEVPYAPCPSMAHHWSFGRWSICGGYRPSLLSPLIFVLPSSQDEKGKKQPQLEQSLLRALNL